MLIINAEIYQVGNADLRIESGIISDIGKLTAQPGEMVVDAGGCALIPGLNDHHLHFLSYAASLGSVSCSPTSVKDRSGLAQLLSQHSSGDAWLRGIGYHESIAGDIDCAWLDQYCYERPVRIQHRSGRLWIFNSAGIECLKQAMRESNVTALPDRASLLTGRFYDAETLLSNLLGRQLPPVRISSERLASFGITGFSDMTPSNDEATLSLYERLSHEGSLLQNVQLARSTPFHIPTSTLINQGPVKIHLHESRLPPLEELVNRIQQSHAASVPVAVHCVTEIELLYTLAALEESGTVPGDRIEHASITPEYALERIKALNITIVTQPNFIEEKGDTYLSEIEDELHPTLYRCRTFLNWKIPLGGSSDAPFGSPDPWKVMRSAISRQTSGNQLIGTDEALSPEQALNLYLGSLESPGKIRVIRSGAPADLCLLQHPWDIARLRLNKEDVRMVWIRGRQAYTRELEKVGLVGKASSI